MTGASMVVQAIADEGVSAIFGYSGGAVLPCYDAVFLYNEQQAKLGRRQLPLIVPANEQAAGFMAAGYSRSTGQVGVAMVTSGPGATNMVTPVRDCAADSIPMVVICGQVPRAAIGSDAFQEAPIASIMGAVAKHVFLVTDPEKLEGIIRAAFELARSGRPGPVVVDIPKDVQNWQGVYRGTGTAASIGVYQKRMRELAARRVSEAQLDSFFALLGKSRRPLIYAGGGVIHAGAASELREFSRLLGIPVVTTLMGIGAVDTYEALSLRMLGMHGSAFANYAVDDCDFLITLGARFDDRVAGSPAKFAPRARAIAQFDIDAAEINKVKQVAWHHVGDLKDSLRSLVSRARELSAMPDLSTWHQELEALKRDHAMDFDRNSPMIQPYYVIEEINRHTRGEAIISTGVGQHQMWAAQYFDFREPRLWLTSGSMGTMGFGLPAALGAQVAHPERLVIDIDGDASIRMNMGELETATTYNLPVKVCVLNNIGDGMVRQWQKLFFGGRMASTDKSLHTKDFVKAAQADGFQYAARLSNKADVPRVVAEWLAFPGPAFLEVMIDPDAGVYPMVPPGQGYDGMITGDFIKGRKAAPAEKPGASEMF
ncbi:MAG: biosynthetic-type acetolactate synthase large subunit [Proteobacteria bacterium]|nr:biosynthetic-type acetolactate synthase large subunit [Pseudomonadota bacterium]MBK7116284.1 biosynthetic-type acetolactate synthase large subunit [Pseudomonadota bacterium]MBK9252388.1 biosynthetic-type acetolactate synthase large subunit [Pseudomonadota bacterium]MCC6633049.1 biosynthetic-type acetolactate synthase large subunit [Gammaproteobacteria bacterium]